jgi:aryl-phospho-beta-D-glucosidase BglC (GH1 family)
LIGNLKNNKMTINHKIAIKKLWPIQLIILLFIFLLSCSKDSNPNPVKKTTFVSAFEVIDAMGTGFNLGNTFDYELQSTNPTSIFPIIDLYANAGMKHIRIPVTWMDGFGGNTLADSNGNINFSHARFIQLKAVIDYAINKKMFVVLNTHHEHWLNNNYNGSVVYNTSFSNLWTGIATYFKDYSHLLIFEVLNEPHGVFGDWSGGSNPSSTTALALTRQINKVGYDAIRAIGGLNLNRVVMVSTNGMGNHSQLDDVYPTIASLPGGGSDKYLSFHLHTYDPWAFCGQNGSNSSWPGSTSIANSVISVSNSAESLNVPVNYGEFGVGRDANASERNTDIVREYYRTMRLTCLSKKMAPTVWDDRGWFGLVHSNGNNFLYSIIPYMMAP